MAQFDLLQFPRATPGICVALLARGRGIVYSVPVPGVGGGGQIKTGFLRNFPILFCPVAVLSKKYLSCFLWFPFHF